MSSLATEPGVRPSPRRAHAIPLLLIGVVYAAVAAQQIDLPGVYMDAVNPDYLAVRALYPHALAPVWLLPGNFLADRFTILMSLYHGTQTLWLGLPVFWLLGTTVTSLRLAHALFGLSVLLAAYAVLVRGGVWRWWAAATCLVLALDPSFVYAFRTQSYITLQPTVWLLLSIYALQRRAAPGCRYRTPASFVSGLLFGLAVYGYFVYAFYLPALVFAVAFWRGEGEIARLRLSLRYLLAWCVGMLCGLVFYLIGYVLLAQALTGLAKLGAYIIQMQADLGAFGANQSPWDRIAYAWAMVEAVVHNWWHHKLIFDEYASVPAAEWKMAILIGLPAILWAYAEWQRRAGPLLRLLLGLELSFFLGAMIFGNRLGGHHFVSLLPLSYTALAVAVQQVTGIPRAGSSRANRAAPVLLLGAMLAINVLGEVREAARLRETHGVGLYSDAINRLADDLRRGRDDDFIVTPDWGLFMPVAFLTGGRFEMATDEDYASARRVLCNDRRVRVALIGGDRPARFARWQQELGAEAPETRDYRQHDGTLLFQIATFRKSVAQGCVDDGPAAR